MNEEFNAIVSSRTNPSATQQGEKMSRSRKSRPTPMRVIVLNLVYPLIAFSLITLACNTVTRVIDNPAGDSPSPGSNPTGIGGPTRPVGFVNHGRFNAVVMPWTFVRLGSDISETPPSVSTVSTVPTSPGLWPNSSRFLSLPLGTYTWCFEWDEGDLNDDGNVDYFHFFDERSVTIDENTPNNPDLAIQVDFSTPPEGGEEILSGQCGDGDESDVIINPTPNIEIITPTEEPKGKPVDIDPCDLMPPGGKISTQNETTCVAQYSSNPSEKVVQIQPLQYNTDTDTLCRGLLEPSDYHVFMSEVDFGDCGIQAEISYQGKPAPGYTGWEIIFYYKRINVRIATSQDYPANKSWIYDTAESIEKIIQGYY